MLPESRPSMAALLRPWLSTRLPWRYPTAILAALLCWIAVSPANANFPFPGPGASNPYDYQNYMFITNADVYYHNFFFRSKMALLALAGLNMLIFELTAGRSVHAWDKDKSAPRAARAAAVLSLVVWITIIFMGRWIGFTTSHSQAKPDSDINLEDIFPK